MASQYRLFVPKQAVGANLVYFDLFNNSKDVVVVRYVQSVMSGAVAVVGTLGVDLFLTRTSAVGTGGTAATYEGTSLTACTISAANGKSQPCAATITARLTPTGGATADGVLAWTCLFTEETSSAAYSQPYLTQNDEIILPNGTGIRVVQGAVASVGNIGFNVGFDISK